MTNKEIFSFISCSISALLVDVANTFDLTESQQGLLQTVFILVYMITAPLYGYLGDRFNRKFLMAAGVFMWSLGTLIGSFMQVRIILLIYC